MNLTQYKEAFGIDPLDLDKLKAAFDQAVDIRKFEIELYWKRAAYFWTLIAASFAAFFLIFSAKALPQKDLLAFTVSCAGFLFTFAWFQVNRGSKQWQENWEIHLDMLEDRVTGPLYKTILKRPDGGTFSDRYITGPSDISASKTNQLVNLFTLIIWLFLGHVSLGELHFDWPLSYKHVFIGAVTIIFCFLILRFGRTFKGSPNPIANQRQTSLT